MTSYHPPSSNRSHGMDDDNDSGYDIERQGSGWNRRSVNSSAFSHLEGRSYRFQPSQDPANLATSLVPAPTPPLPLPFATKPLSSPA